MLKLVGFQQKVCIGLKPLILIGIMMRFSLTKEGSVVNYGSIDGQSELTLEPAHVHECPLVISSCLERSDAEYR